MITKTINLYTFDELSDKAKEHAREWWREGENLDFGSDGSLNEPIETAAKLLGIEFKHHDVELLSGKTRSEPNIWWELHVQGAGASFDANYAYAKGSVKKVASEFPQDEELKRIAVGLAALQKPFGYSLTARISSTRRGQFICAELDPTHKGPVNRTHAPIQIQELMGDFARWIYHCIDAEYSFRMSDENVDESIRANEYTFTEYGRREDA